MRRPEFRADPDGLASSAKTYIARYYLLCKDNEQSGVRTGAGYLDLDGVLSTLN